LVVGAAVGGAVAGFFKWGLPKVFPAPGTGDVAFSLTSSLTDNSSTVVVEAAGVATTTTFLSPSIGQAPPDAYWQIDDITGALTVLKPITPDIQAQLDLTASMLGINIPNPTGFTYVGDADPTNLDDLIIGGSGTDTLSGLTGNDVLAGGLGADILSGGPGNDKLDGAPGADRLTGGSGADIFYFEVASVTEAVAATPVLDRITDYDRGNSGAYSASEGDQISLSDILSTAYKTGQPVSSLVRVVVPPGKTFAKLQVDTDGSNSDAKWVTIAILDGLAVGNTANVILDDGAPAGVPIPVIAAPANDFNGNGGSDILWRAINGSDGFWSINGNQRTAVDLPAVPTAWHVLSTPDFNGDGQDDVLWRGDNGAISAWLMNGGQRTAVDLPALPLAWHFVDAADYNGDGNADILWRGDNGAASLWLMNGGVPTPTDLPSISLAWTLVDSADFNGDGRADILWRGDNGAVSLWLMNGGQVTPVDLPSVATSWTILGAGDFNGDGRADMLWQADNGSTSLWLMGANNQRTPVDLPSVPASWHFVKLADFNGDGKTDVLWRSGAGDVSVWLMNGGQRTVVDLPSVPNAWQIADVLDFNGDGRADIFWRADNGANSIWFMNGAGGVASVADIPSLSTDWKPVVQTTDPPTAKSGSVLAIEDQVASGTLGASDLDHTAGQMTFSRVQQAAHGSVTIAPNGVYTYTPAGNYFGPDSFTFKVNDGTQDSNVATVAITVLAVNDAPVITSNGGADTATIVLPENTTAATTVTATDIDGPTLAYAIIGGADQSKFSINSSTGALSFLANPNFEFPADSDHNNSYVVQIRASDGGTPNLSDTQTITVNIANVFETANDANGDGHGDMFWHGDNGANSIWLLNGAQRTPVDLPQLSTAWHAIDTVDFNGDGRTDILWHGDNGATSLWLLNGGQRTVADLPTLSTSWHIVDTADFNHDGNTDILWRGDNGATSIWLIDSNGQRTPLDLPSLNTAWHVAGAADFDGDGNADIFWRGDNGADSIWLVNGTGRAGIIDLPQVPVEWHVASTADFSGDGRADILWRGDNGANSLWLMNGAQHTVVDLPSVDPAWHIISTADFNGDGRTDILWRGDNGANSIWLMNGANHSVLDLPALNTAWHLDGTPDVNGDGSADIFWRGDNGATSAWIMNGTSAPNIADFPILPTEWHAITSHYELM
jgi:VCBS repeat-containing protein